MKPRKKIARLMRRQIAYDAYIKTPKGSADSVKRAITRPGSLKKS